MAEQPATQKQDRGQRTKFKLPIDITQAGKLVPAGKDVDLFPDQIERIKAVAAERQKAVQKVEG